MNFRGCKLWLRADTVTKDGGNLVSQYTDKSGNGNSYVQSTSANKTIWVDGAYNGHPTVRGQDVTDNLTRTAVSLGTAATLFLALVQGTDVNNWMMINSTQNSGLISRFDAAKIEWYNNGGADRYTIASGPVGLHIITVRQTNGAALQAWLDGVSVFGPVVPVAPLTDVESFFGRAGAVNGSAGLDIPEAILYDAALPDNERQFAERAMGHFWGVLVA